MIEFRSNEAATMSPSSRRAWIEIIAEAYSSALDGIVALLAEGVDRNPTRSQ